MKITLKKEQFIALAILGTTCSSFAQSIDSNVSWSRAHKTGSNAAVTPAAMTEDENGYIYVVGTSNPTGSNPNAVVLKINPSDGSLIASQDLGGSDKEYGYDIAYEGGSLYVLGRYNDGNPAHAEKMYVVKLTTSLSTTWQNWVTPPSPYLKVAPYRLATRTSGSTTEVYVTSQVGEITSPITMSAETNDKVFYAKIDPSSGSVTYSGVVDPQPSTTTATPDWLFGAHAVSGGLVLVTDTQQSMTASGMFLGTITGSRVWYTKISDSSASTLWTVPGISTLGYGTPPTGVPGNVVHKLSQTAKKNDYVYTSLGGGENPADLNSYDFLISADCSTNSSGGPTFDLSDYYSKYYNTWSFIGPPMPMPTCHSEGVGVIVLSESVRALGTEAKNGGTDFMSVGDTKSRSWYRQGSTELDYVEASTTPSDATNEFLPTQNQRCADGHTTNSVDFMALARFVPGGSTFWFLSEKSSKLSGYVTVGDTTSSSTTYYGSPIQVMVSQVQTGCAYVLLPFYDTSSAPYVGIAKVVQP